MNERLYSIRPVVFIGLLFALLAVRPSTVQAQFNLRLNSGGGIHLGTTGSVPAPIRELTKSSKTKFQEAVLANDVEKATQYVKAEYVNEEFKGYPPVVHSAAHGNTEMVQLLVSNGATVEYRHDGHSLAYIAAAIGWNETARTLVELGGGSMQDVARGHTHFVENSKRQQEQVASNRDTINGVAKLLFGNSNAQTRRGYHTCPVCHGLGELKPNFVKCYNCDGTGEVPD